MEHWYVFVGGTKSIGRLFFSVVVVERGSYLGASLYNFTSVRLHMRTPAIEGGMWPFGNEFFRARVVVVEKGDYFLCLVG